MHDQKRESGYVWPQKNGLSSNVIPNLQHGRPQIIPKGEWETRTRCDEAGCQTFNAVHARDFLLTWTDHVAACVIALISQHGGGDCGQEEDRPLDHRPAQPRIPVESTSLVCNARACWWVWRHATFAGLKDARKLSNKILVQRRNQTQTCFRRKSIDSDKAIYNKRIKNNYFPQYDIETRNFFIKTH